MNNDLKSLENFENKIKLEKNSTMIEKIKEQLMTVQEQISNWKSKTHEFLHKHFDYPYLIMLWVTVLVFLLFLGIETKFSKDQDTCYYFIIQAYKDD